MTQERLLTIVLALVAACATETEQQETTGTPVPTAPEHPRQATKNTPPPVPEPGESPWGFKAHGSPASIEIVATEVEEDLRRRSRVHFDIEMTLEAPVPMSWTWAYQLLKHGDGVTVPYKAPALTEISEDDVGDQEFSRTLATPWLDEGGYYELRVRLTVAVAGFTDPAMFENAIFFMKRDGKYWLVDSITDWEHEEASMTIPLVPPTKGR